MSKRKELQIETDKAKRMQQVYSKAMLFGGDLMHNMHEMTKILMELSAVYPKDTPFKNEIKVNRCADRLKTLFDECINNVYATKNSDNHKIRKIIEQSLFNIDYRLRSHKIELVQGKTSECFYTYAQRAILISVLGAIFDNAIYWLGVANRDNKKILIESYVSDDFNVVLIADNGDGLTIMNESIFDLFVSGQEDEVGAGIGLFLVKRAMEAYGGDVEIGDWKKEGLNKEFNKGLVIKLKFKPVLIEE